jgi:hypothetical protein
MNWFVAIPLIVPPVLAFIILVSPLWPIAHGPRHKKTHNMKRFGIFVLVNVIVSAMTSGLMYRGGISKLMYPEVWNYKILKIRHEEKWTEEESRTREVPDGTDEEGNTTYRTETYYVTETYGPYWNAIDEYGKSRSINQGEYIKWRNLWVNQKKVGEHKGSSAGFDRSITGEIFECNWPRSFETIYPKAKIYRYKNKVRQSYSIMKFGKPTEEMVKKYPRPADKSNTSPIISYGGIPFNQEEKLMMRRVNANMGKRYEIHTILVVIKSDTYRGIVGDILCAWEGPNKNELVTFLCVEEGIVKWCEVHSWIDNTTIHAMLRDELTGEQFSIQKYASLLQQYIPQHWRRKKFADFDYLRVSIHAGWVIAALIISLIIAVVSFLVIENHSTTGYRSYGYRR